MILPEVNIKEEKHLYGCPKCQTKTELPIEPKKKCPKCKTKLIWLYDSRDMPDGKPNFELINQLITESDVVLRCKGCGSTDFKILQNKAHSDYRYLFAAEEACAKCGLIAYMNNLIGHTSKSYESWNSKPIKPDYIKAIMEKRI